MKKLIVLSSLLLMQGLFAEDIYIAQTAQGSDTGANAANAHSISWFNTSGNWDTDVSNDGKIGPGDTVHWTGTISTAAVIQGSGSSGNRITFEWDGVAKFSAAYWSINGAIQIGNQSYLTFDGKNTGTVGARATVDGATWNVSLECTANGTLLANQQETRGIVGNGGRDITLRNIRSKNLYVREPYGTDINEYGGFCSIAVTANASIENCYIAEGIDGIVVKAGGAGAVPGINVSDCTILRISNGIKPGVNSGYIDRATIVRNRIDELDIYSNYFDDPDDGEDNHHHNDGIQTILISGSGRVYQMTIAYNHIGPNIGTFGHTTSPIFLQYDNEDCRVYNNYIEYAPGHWSSNAAISINQGEGWSSGEGPGLIANNTVIVRNATVGQTGYGSTHHSIIGNVGYGTNTAAGHLAGSTGSLDYNVYWGRTGDGGDIEFYDGTSIYSLSGWRSTFGYDIHTVNDDPLFNSNGTLQAGSPAIGFAPTQTIFNDDFYGNPRTVPWDAGAFESSSGPPPGIQTLNVQNLRIGP